MNSSRTMNSSRSSGARAALLLLLASRAAAQWDTLCPGATGGPYSAWNETRCPSASSTCCPSGFNPSGVGCCPFVNAVCCPGSQFACCPSGSTCKLVDGSGSYDSRYECSVAATGAPAGVNAATCKGGPPLPMATDGRKNVLWIGDSLSLGMIPIVAANLSSIALVQHAPWGGDGGAEEAAYTLRCLDFFLASPSGMAITPDLILFNSGMHQGPMGNQTWPGQNAPPDTYAGELAAITDRLRAFTARTPGAQLVFAHTTPYLCSAAADGCVQSLNNAADAVMAAAGVPVIDPYGPIVAKCGKAPVQNCFGETGCFCPHCPSGYAWVANTVIIPALRALLLGSA